MRLTVIGCGDAFGSGGRFNTCFMIEADGCTVLLDCGASSLVALKARSVDLNTIDGVILSHLHGDHFGALPFLLLDSQFHSRRERPLTIAGPPGTRERLDAACEAFFPRSNRNVWRFPLRVREISPGVADEVLGFAVTTAEVIHQSGAPSTAVRLAREGRVLGYSGDTEWTDVLIAVADGADLFVIECYDYARDLSGHMSFARLKEKRAGLRARRIMLTHMNPTMLARTDEARREGFLVADDGLAIEVDPRKAAPDGSGAAPIPVRSISAATDASRPANPSADQTGPAAGCRRTPAPPRSLPRRRTWRSCRTG
jgi:ribonuclease BN (tRNA processing enzyme)